VLAPLASLERLGVRWFAAADLRRLPRGVRAVEVQLAGSQCAREHIRQAKVAMMLELKARVARDTVAWLETAAALSPPVAETVSAAVVNALDELHAALKDVQPSTTSLRAGLGTAAADYAAGKALTASELVDKAVVLLRSALPPTPARERAGEGPGDLLDPAAAQRHEREEAARLAAAWERVAAAFSRDAFARLGASFRLLANRFAAGVAASTAQRSTLKVSPPGWWPARP
jgi:hypothetical protein